MLRVAVAILLLVLPAAAFAQSKLRVGVEGNYPPFSQMGADGRLAGFDVDIAEAVCADLKRECQLVQQEFDGMIPALNARKFDMTVASLAINEERKKAVDFSDSYYDVPSRWIAKTGTITDTSP